MNHLKMGFIVLLLVTSCNRAITTPSISDTPTPVIVPRPTSVVSDTQPMAIVSPLVISDTNLVLTFSGQISRGQIFEQEISEALIFRLNPYQYGWEIWMGDKTKPLDDYVGVVTPPYYGMNATDIEGWHFRNSDNSGPNEPGPKLVQAPQKERRFHFVVNEEDYRVAYNGLDTRQVDSEEERKQRWEQREQLKLREGTLTITQLELGNLEVGEQAWIESMEFEVELSLPSDFE